MVATVASGEKVVDLIDTLEPDVVLLDLHMPGIGGIEALRLVRQHGATARVLVLTGVVGDQEALGAISAGADGYGLKHAPSAQLRVAIRALAAGQAYVDPAVTNTVLSFARQGFREAGGPWHLSRREMEVLELVAEGLGNREIAVRLFLSEPTVRSHIKTTLRKMGKRHRLEAVLTALQVGLLQGTRLASSGPEFTSSGDANHPLRGSALVPGPAHTEVRPST